MRRVADLIEDYLWCLGEGRAPLWFCGFCGAYNQSIGQGMWFGEVVHLGFMDCGVTLSAV